jgi:hypothetical protein
VTPADWAGIGASIVVVLGALMATLRFVIKGYLAELKPNGGSSLNDKIKLELMPIVASIREDLTEMKVKQAEIQSKLETHTHK